METCISRRKGSASEKSIFNEFSFSPPNEQSSLELQQTKVGNWKLILTALLTRPDNLSKLDIFPFRARLRSFFVFGN